MLEWRIYPTSVKIGNTHGGLDGSRDPEGSNEILVRPRLSRKQRDPEGSAVSRDELFRDLLKNRRREIHVEDFLWTGSGKSTILICSS